MPRSWTILLLPHLAALVKQPLPDARDIAIAEICTDTYTSARLSSNCRATHFSTLLKEGGPLPAIILFYGQQTRRYYVGNGSHRLETDRTFFQQLGFQIERHPFTEVAHLLVSPNLGSLATNIIQRAILYPITLSPAQSKNIT